MKPAIKRDIVDLLLLFSYTHLHLYVLCCPAICQRRVILPLFSARHSEYVALVGDVWNMSSPRIGWLEISLSVNWSFLTGKYIAESSAHKRLEYVRWARPIIDISRATERIFQ